MNYTQIANPNATNSELDAKKIVCYEDNRVIDCKELQQTPLKTYQIECMETVTFTVEVEAQSEDQARELAHADINSFEVISEGVSEWEINLIEEAQ